MVIDSSGSFKGHQYEAIKKVGGLLKKIGEKKERRYEAIDEIYIVSLDARSEVIWAGNRQQLDQLTEKLIAELFGKREGCLYATDIAGAFNLAAHKLDREPMPTDKWLFVFSDLIDEPPLPGNKSQPPENPSPPSSQIRWDRLADTSISIFWTPDQQIMVWEDTLTGKGLSLKFYDEAEALNIELAPPPKARKEMTKEERIVAKERIRDGIDIAKAMGIKMLCGLAIFIIAVILLAVAGNYFARHHSNSGRR